MKNIKTKIDAGIIQAKHKYPLVCRIACKGLIAISWIIAVSSIDKNKKISEREIQCIANRSLSVFLAIPIIAKSKEATNNSNDENQVGIFASRSNKNNLI